ncbi:MAG: LamG domain-containing protein, partial [Proteobacteria bacterium]|nr:LamG domain-containing protein [Pseudomonadota bacterium]
SANLAIDLPLAGTYQIHVQTDGGTTGGFSFRLLDLGAAPVVTVGPDEVSGTLTPARTTAMYGFDVAGPARVFFDQRAFSTYTSWASVRLIDPWGRQIAGPSNVDDQAWTLLAAGRYTLLIEGRVWDNSGGTSYKFALLPIVDPSATTLVVGDRTTGSIASPGQALTYTFTLADPAALYFDSFTDNDQINWTLTGPSGFSVSRNLRNGESWELGGANPVMQAAAGSYTLTFTGNGATTGTVDFRVLDVSKAAKIDADVQVAGALTPARTTDAYTFSATTGDRFYFRLEALADPSWYSSLRLIDPYGRQVFGPDETQNHAWTAAATGTYTLLIEGRVWDGNASNPYKFTLIHVVDPAPLALVVGAVTDAEITQPSQVARYSFTLSGAASLYLDSLTDNDQVNWTLTGPAGFSVSRNLRNGESYELGGANPVMQAGAGTYTLSFTANGTQTPKFSFRLLNTSEATALTLGAPVAGTLSPARSTIFYSFDATAGQSYFLNVVARSLSDNWISLRVLDPLGRQVFGPENFGDRQWTPALTGQYLLVVEGRIWVGGDATYRFVLNSVDPVNKPLAPSPVGTGLISTQGVIGTALVLTGQEGISIPGQAELNPTGDFTLDVWVRPDRFTAEWMPLVWKGDGPNGIRSYSLWINSQGYVHFSIMDRGGAGNDALSSAVGSVPGGIWTRITAVADRTNGVMRLYLNGVEVANGSLTQRTRAADDLPLLFGRSQESWGWGGFVGTIDDVRLWSRALSAADVAGTQATPLTGAEPDLVLYLSMDDPAWSSLIHDSGPLGLTVSVTNPLTFADLTDATIGRIEQAGQTVTYTFHVAATRLVYFDGLIDDDQFNIAVDGPAGRVLSRNLRNGDSYEFGGGNPVATLAPGDYTMTVWANGDRTGTYAFRLVDLSSAKLLALDAPTALTLKPGASTALYQFTGTAGQSIFVDRQGTGYGGDVTWRLIDPVGRQVWGPGNFEDFAVGLALTGTYTLLVEGRIWRRDQQLTSSFGVYSITNQTVAVSPGGANPVAGPWWTTGKLGGGLALNGADQVELADAPALNVTGSATIEAWVRLDHFDNSWTPIIYKGAADGSFLRTYALWVNNDGSVLGSTFIGTSEQTVRTGGGQVALGTWTHLALVFDRTAGQARIYVNGTLAATNGLSQSSAPVTDGPLIIGAQTEAANTHGRVQGIIDEVQIWSVARSGADIAATMNDVPDTSDPTLRVYLPYEEGTGTSIANLGSAGGTAAWRTLNPNGITGRIVTPGATETYTFTLATDTLLYIDSLT